MIHLNGSELMMPLGKETFKWLCFKVYFDGKFQPERKDPGKMVKIKGEKV